MAGSGHTLTIVTPGQIKFFILKSLIALHVRTGNGWSVPDGVGALQLKVPAEIDPLLSSLEIIPTLNIKSVPVIDILPAMALGEIRLRDWQKVIRRELMAGLALGAILGALGVTRILLWHILRGTYGTHYLVIALTIGFSLVGVVMFGTLAGSMLPFILRSCRLDPASASAPFGLDYLFQRRKSDLARHPSLAGKFFGRADVAA